MFDGRDAGEHIRQQFDGVLNAIEGEERKEGCECCEEVVNYEERYREEVAEHAATKNALQLALDQLKEATFKRDKVAVLDHDKVTDVVVLLHTLMKVMNYFASEEVDGYANHTFGPNNEKRREKKLASYRIEWKDRHFSYDDIQEIMDWLIEQVEPAVGEEKVIHCNTKEELLEAIGQAIEQATKK
jgi:DNA-binding transcriptional MerR regulator